MSKVVSQINNTKPNLYFSQNLQHSEISAYMVTLWGISTYVSENQLVRIQMIEQRTN